MAQTSYRPTVVVPDPDPVHTPTSAWSVGVIARLVVTLIGSAVMIVAAFFDWVGSIGAVNLDIHAFYQGTFRTQAGFFRTVGAVLIVVALGAVVGAALHSGWLTRLAAVLAIVGAALVLVQVYRFSAHPAVGAGPWIYLVGALIALIAGFLGPRAVTSTPASLSTIAE